MKSLFSLIVLVLLGALIFSCEDNAPKKITADMISSAMSSAIIFAGDCKAPDVVKADVKPMVYEWFKIQDDAEKGIVQDLCKVAIKEIAPKIVGVGFKVTWLCEKTKIDDAAEYLSEMACAKIKI